MPRNREATAKRRFFPRLFRDFAKAYIFYILYILRFKDITEQKPFKYQFIVNFRTRMIKTTTKRHKASDCIFHHMHNTIIYCFSIEYFQFIVFFNLATSNTRLAASVTQFITKKQSRALYARLLF